jgi:hypothetical protein
MDGRTDFLGVTNLLRRQNFGIQNKTFGIRGPLVEQGRGLFEELFITA